MRLEKEKSKGQGMETRRPIGNPNITMPNAQSANCRPNIVCIHTHLYTYTHVHINYVHVCVY